MLAIADLDQFMDLVNERAIIESGSVHKMISFSYESRFFVNTTPSSQTQKKMFAVHGNSWLPLFAVLCENYSVWRVLCKKGWFTGPYVRRVGLQCHQKERRVCKDRFRDSRFAGPHLGRVGSQGQMYDEVGLHGTMKGRAIVFEAGLLATCKQGWLAR